jgi:hypothetical protein
MLAVSDNQQRANELLDLAPMGGTNRLLHAVAAALDAAEARGRAELAAKVEALHVGQETTGRRYCQCCGSRMPCPTLRAIADDTEEST